MIQEGRPKIILPPTTPYKLCWGEGLFISWDRLDTAAPSPLGEVVHKGLPDLVVLGSGCELPVLLQGLNRHSSHDPRCEVRCDLECLLRYCQIFIELCVLLAPVALDLQSTPTHPHPLTMTATPHRVGGVIFIHKETNLMLLHVATIVGVAAEVPHTIHRSAIRIPEWFLELCASQ